MKDFKNIIIKNKQKILTSSVKVNILLIFGVVLIAFFSFQAGLISQNKINPSADFAYSGEALDSVDTSELEEVWKLLETKFPFEQPDGTNKVYGLIDGLISSYGDKYTTFFRPRDAKIFRDEISGEFGGVGIEIEVINGYVTIISPLEGSPAKKAGLKPGDIILKVDGTDILKLKYIDDIVELIRGDVGKHVVLTIARIGKSETLDIDIVRDIVKIPVIKSKIVNNVFVIELYTFSSKSYQEFKEKINEFNKTKLQSLIIDLRGNPGGLLDASIDISDIFLQEGTTIVKEVKKETENIYRARKKVLIKKNTNIVILTNKGSASASEIVAGALRDNGKARIVGQNTFGKGSVQELFRIGKKAAVKITIAKWLTPSGKSISDGGITPDLIVSNEDIKIFYSKEENKNKDIVLEKAIELLSTEK